jgi:probable phosphoglycerate mutase
MQTEMIYLVRHGQTEWNRDGILQGQLDSRLTERGLRQAKAIGQHLAGIIKNPVDVYIESSHLGRARATAEIIRAIIGLDASHCSATELLAEIHLGKWQGLDKTQIEAYWPGRLAEREQNKWHYKIPGGENYCDLENRAERWLAQQRLAPVTIAVSHQQFSNILRGIYAKLTRAETLRLTHEQHCFFLMQNGNIERNCADE